MLALCLWADWRWVFFAHLREGPFCENSSQVEVGTGMMVKWGFLQLSLTDSACRYTHISTWQRVSAHGNEHGVWGGSLGRKVTKQIARVRPTRWTWRTRSMKTMFWSWSGKISWKRSGTQFWVQNRTRAGCNTCRCSAPKIRPKSGEGSRENLGWKTPCNPTAPSFPLVWAWGFSGPPRWSLQTLPLGGGGLGGSPAHQPPPPPQKATHWVQLDFGEAQLTRRGRMVLRALSKPFLTEERSLAERFPQDKRTFWDTMWRYFAGKWPFWAQNGAFWPDSGGLVSNSVRIVSD